MPWQPPVSEALHRMILENQLRNWSANLEISDAIKLASNENPLGPPPAVSEYLRSAATDLHRYPDGSGFELKWALAERHEVGFDQICLGNGSNDVLDMVARVFVSEGDVGIISEHAFIVYYLSLAYVHAKIKIVKAKEYGHDVGAMVRAVDERTRIVYFANPNNPTGTWSSAEELRSLLDEVPSSVIVVIDEAYAEYVAESDYPDCISWLSEYPNLVVTRTFSKIYALAGLRIGYSVSSPEISNLMNRVRQPFNCNSLAMSSALVALGDRNHCEKSARLNCEQMRTLRQGFSEMGFETIDSVANFLCVDMKIPAMDSYRKLLERGVIVRPIGGYGMPNHLRVSVGTASENSRLLDTFNSLKNQGLI